MKLSTLKPNPGSRRRRKLVGRGESSGHGKTSCRGGKGQTARAGGKIRAGFEGGQMPLYRRLPKLGFVSRQQSLGLNRYHTVTLAVLEQFESGTVIDEQFLRQQRIVSGSKERAGIKILGTGKLTKKLTIKAEKVTAGARKAIEEVGGSVELLAAKAADAAAQNSQAESSK